MDSSSTDRRASAPSSQQPLNPTQASDVDNRPSIIPTRTPKRAGMPKLQLPTRPATSSSSSSSAAPTPPFLAKGNNKPSGLRLPGSGLGNGAGASGSASTSPQPSLSLAIPTTHSFSTLSNDIDDGYEGSAGSSLTGVAQYLPGSDGPGQQGSGFSTTHASIYPDTVPHAYGAQDSMSMRQDLRRAIGALSIDDRTAGENDRALAGLNTSTSSASTGNGSQVSLQIPSSASSSSQSQSQSSSPSQLRISPSRTGNSTNSASFSSLAAPSTASSISPAPPAGSAIANIRASGRSPGKELEDESELKLQGNLEPLDRLGEGASGEVRKACYKPTGMIVAMKTISTSPNPAIHRQILRELAFNRTCHSEYIVRYYGAYLADEDTSIVICMEHCEAGSLDGLYKRIKLRNGRMGEKILAKIAESGLQGLAYLHERKIIHRDIKPSNILVTRDGQIKLCDFGVSGELINSMAGTFTGTSFYMAPERIKGSSYNITSDVWSLGLTILELASNRFPFPPEGEPPLGPIDLLSYVISMKVPELKDDPAAGIKWSKAFKDFLEHCLEKDGMKRYVPAKMAGHPWIKKSMARVPQPDMGRFVAEVWGWPVTAPPTPASSAIEPDETQTQAKSIELPPLPPIPNIVAENIDVPGLGRVASVRRAPAPIGPMRRAASPGQASRSVSEKQAEQTAPGSRQPASLSLLVDRGGLNAEGIDLEGRTPLQRAEARQREADVGLIGSPTHDGDNERNGKK